MPGQCRCIFLQNTALKVEFHPKRAKTNTRGCKITQTWPYMAPKGAQFEPKGHQNEPKGCQRGAKSIPKIDKNNTKNHNLEKGRKRGGALLSFGDIFDVFLNKNVSKNRSEKLCRKTRQKNVKLSKKQGTIQPQKIDILKFLMQRRFLQNSVFTREKQCVLKIPCFESVHKFEKHPRKK